MLLLVIKIIFEYMKSIKLILELDKNIQLEDLKKNTNTYVVRFNNIIKKKLHS